MSKSTALAPKKYFLVALLELVSCQVISVYRRIVRAALHLITGRSELERICLNEKVESARIRKIESNLRSSKNKYLNDSVAISPDANQENEEVLVLNIMKAKQIKQNNNNLNILLVMKDGLIKINAYNRLLYQIEELRRKTFSFDNYEDSQKLMDIWSRLKGGEEKLDSNVTSRWTEIGFQGKDPSTDFRGMGMLAVANLHYFTTECEETATQVYSRSLHPKFWYPFAIVGINITSWIYHMLSDGHLKTHFYNDSALLDKSKFDLQNFNKIYSIIFVEFDSFWFANEPNVMDFERLSSIFKVFLNEKLRKDPQAIVRKHFLGKNYKLAHLSSSLRY